AAELEFRAVMHHLSVVGRQAVDGDERLAEQLHGPRSGWLAHKGEVPASNGRFLRRIVHVAFELAPEQDAILARLDLSFSARQRAGCMPDSQHSSAPPRMDAAIGS